MKAAWPSTGCPVDSSALEQYEALKQLVRGVRNARLEYGLEQARKVGVWMCVVCVRIGRHWWRKETTFNGLQDVLWHAKFV